MVVLQVELYIALQQVLQRLLVSLQAADKSQHPVLDQNTQQLSDRMQQLKDDSTIRFLLGMSLFCIKAAVTQTASHALAAIKVAQALFIILKCCV